MVAKVDIRRVGKSLRGMPMQGASPAGWFSLAGARPITLEGVRRLLACCHQYKARRKELGRTDARGSGLPDRPQPVRSESARLSGYAAMPTASSELVHLA